MFQAKKFLSTTLSRQCAVGCGAAAFVCVCVCVCVSDEEGEMCERDKIVYCNFDLEKKIRFSSKAEN